MKLVQEPKVAAQAFEAGETDFAIINSDLVDKYKKDESFKNISEGFLFYVQPNLENADLANLNVRKAISLAINRKDLCENVLKDGSQAAKGFVPSGLSISPEGKDFRDEAATYTSYDKKAAQAALDEGLKELGKSEITLRLTYGTDESPMDVFATYLQNAFSSLKGLKIEMVATTKQDRIYNKQKKGDFQDERRYYHSLFRHPCGTGHHRRRHRKLAPCPRILDDRLPLCHPPRRNNRTRKRRHPRRRTLHGVEQTGNRHLLCRRTGQGRSPRRYTHRRATHRTHPTGEGATACLPRCEAGARTP